MRAAIVLFLLVVGMLWLTKSNDPPTKGNDPSPTATKAVDTRNTEVDLYIARQKRLMSVEISKFSWQKGGFDNVMLATFTLKNTNDFTVKDIEIRCEHTANSGTLIDANTRTIYEAIKPKGTKTIRGFNMGLINNQAARSSCHVMNFSTG